MIECKKRHKCEKDYNEETTLFQQILMKRRQSAKFSICMFHLDFYQLL